MKCPCEECLKLAICRFKGYDATIHSCSDIKEFVLNARNHKRRVKKMENALNPYSWYLGDESGKGFAIRYRRYD